MTVATVRQSAAAAYALLTDRDARARHVRALAEGASGLTWQATASAMVEVYREAAEASIDAQQTALARFRRALDARTNP